MRERTDGASEALRLPGKTPPRIGGYEVLGLLGAGAMGRVFLARTASSRLVAVKVIRQDLSADPLYRRRFAREIQAARSIGGVFTAAVVDADPEAETPWLATEYIPAPTLATLIEVCGPLPVEAVRWLAAGCAEALERIHRVGLVHRDVKPGNILVTAHGPVVIDFGLAFTPRSAHLTSADASPGTPAFMAPEQVAHGGAEPTTATDVYALGAALLFAATGHPPYPGPGVESTVYQLLSGEPDLDGVPAALVPLLAQCLSRTQGDRPSCAEILQVNAPYLAEQIGPPLPRLARELLEEYERAPLDRRSTPVDSATVQAGDPTDPMADLIVDPIVVELAAAQDPDATHVSESGRSRPRHAGPASAAPASSASSPGQDPDDEVLRTEPNVERAGRHALTWRRLIVAGSALAVLAIGGGILYGLQDTGGGGRVSAGSTVTVTLAEGTASAMPSGHPGGPGPGGAPAGYPPPSPGTPPRIWIAPSSGTASTRFVLDGANWPPEVPVTLVLSDGSSARTEPFTESNGSLVIALGPSGAGLLPDPLKPGTYRVTAISGPFDVTADFTVLAG